MSERDKAIGYGLAAIVVSLASWIIGSIRADWYVFPSGFLPGAGVHVGYMMGAILCAALAFFVGGLTWSAEQKRRARAVVPKDVL